MKVLIVLAMHGAPPNDYPRSELSEFFGLSSRIAHAPQEQRAALIARHEELDQKIREWPRTAANDPFFAGACALQQALAHAANCEVLLGFNEFCSPTLDKALDQAVDQGAERVVVITPMVTRGGEHSEKEIPEAVQAAGDRHPGVEFRYVWPLDLEAIAGFFAAQARQYLA